MARKGRTKEVYTNGDLSIQLAYASRFDEMKIHHIRPNLRAMAVFGDAIRRRVRDEKTTALGGKLETGHVRTGNMWDSLVANALGGKRGTRLRVAFSKKREDGLYNKDLAYQLTQTDGISLLHPTIPEVEALESAIALEYAEELSQYWGRQFVATGAESSNLAERLRSAFNG